MRKDRTVFTDVENCPLCNSECRMEQTYKIFDGHERFDLGPYGVIAAIRVKVNCPKCFLNWDIEQRIAIDAGDKDKSIKKAKKWAADRFMAAEEFWNRENSENLFRQYNP